MTIDLTKLPPEQNRGALFKNRDKTADSHCDYRGDLNVNGTEYWLSAWLNTSKNGMKYMSLRLRPKESAAANKAKPEFNDEIPF